MLVYLRALLLIANPRTNQSMPAVPLFTYISLDAIRLAASILLAPGYLLLTYSAYFSQWASKPVC